MRLRGLKIIICGVSLSMIAEAQSPRDQHPQEQDRLVRPNTATDATPGSAATGTGGNVSPSASLPKSGTPLSASDPSYIIGPEDVLSVTVWHEAELSASSLPVRPDGKISLPLLNDIQAADLTPMQLAQEITAKLKKYVSEPQVTIVVTGINSKRIYVIGEVARPGVFPLLPRMTVLQALSSAGGLQQYANPKKVYVLRGGQRFPFNYKQALRGQHLDQDILLESGDKIVVP